MRIRELVLLSTLGFYGALCPFTTDFFTSGLPQMVIDLGTDPSVLSQSLYMYMFMTAVGMLFAGPISDRMGRRKLLEIGLVLYILSTFGCSLVDNIQTFIVLRMVQAIGASIAGVTAYAVIKDLYDGPERVTILGIVVFLGAIAGVFAMSIGAFVFESLGWRSIFHIQALIGLLCMLLGLLIPANLPISRGGRGVLDSVMSLVPIIRKDGFVRYLLMISIFASCQYAYTSLATYVYQQHFGVPAGSYGMIMSVGMALSLAVSAVWMRLRLSNYRNHVLIVVFGTLSFLMSSLSSVSVWWFFMLSFVPVMAVSVAVRSFGYDLLMRTHDGDNGSVSSILNVSKTIVGAGGIVFTALFPYDLYLYVFPILTLICCVVYLTMWYLLKRDGYPVKGIV